MNRKTGHQNAGLRRRVGTDAVRCSTRRRLMLAVGAGALTNALAAYPQPRTDKVRRIGFFYIGTRESATETGRYGAFIEGMRELGYVENKHFVVEERFVPEGDYSRLAAVATDLLRSKVDLIVATGTPVVRALLQAKTTIPVVVAITVDPILDGIAASYAHPGGNFTGLSAFLDEIFPKQVELLKIALPKLTRIGVFSKSGNQAHPRLLKLTEGVAQKLGVQVVPVNCDSASDIERGFDAMERPRAQAVIILGDSYFVQHFKRMAELAIKHRLASTYSGSEYPNAGGFMSYGPSFADNFKRTATYIDKIFKGAKPGDLPIEQPTRFYMTINRKTAKAIGIEIPSEMVLRADRIIE